METLLSRLLLCARLADIETNGLTQLSLAPIEFRESGRVQEDVDEYERGAHEQ